MLTCFFENGNKASLRHAVVDCIVLKEGKILLVKRAPQLSNGGKYGLIGGYVNRDETLVQAAAREIQEETGYTIGKIQLFRIIAQPNRKGEDRQNIAFVYVTSAKKKVSLPDDESTDVRWFDLHDLPPADAFAFDHFDDITLYLQHIKKPFPLPILDPN